MDNTDVMRRLVQAAEAWGRQRLGKQMRALTSLGPEAGADGSVSLTVDLYPVEDTTGAAAERPVTCITTLEPDGTISCFTGR